MFPRKAIGTLIGLDSMEEAIGSMLFQFFCRHLLNFYKPVHASTR